MSPPDDTSISTHQTGGENTTLVLKKDADAEVTLQDPSVGVSVDPETKVNKNDDLTSSSYNNNGESNNNEQIPSAETTVAMPPALHQDTQPSAQPPPAPTQLDPGGLDPVSTAPVAPSKGKEPAEPTSLFTAEPDTQDPTSLQRHTAAAASRPPNLDLSATKDTATSAQYLSPITTNYVDPTPPTPQTSAPPSRTPSNARSHTSDELSPSRAGRRDEDKKYVSEDEQDGGSRSEIQSIMEQFSESGGGPGAEEVMSPRLEIASPMLTSSVQHPPRKSSLAPLSTSMSSQFQDLLVLNSSPVSARSKERSFEDQAPPVPPKDGSFGMPPRQQDDLGIGIASPGSPQAPMYRPPPPDPEPEPALPFDFHRFLEQLRNKKADPVARYLKSFLSEFGKRQWMVHEQVKIISDFLAFIANKMALCEVWRDVSDAEFDNAREGMEKLVMNRLYTQTFSPAIPPPKPIPGAKPRRKGADAPMGPGRKGQHQEDVERDDIVTQKINIYGWVKEEHLDIPPVGDSGRRFLKLAQQELLKIKSYRAPRDKIICVLNCCKVIFGLLKHNKSDSSADSFMPLLIYVVLQSNPEHLVSNVQYILRFRNQEKLGGEAGYYLSSLMGAIQFVENLDRTTLTITDEEFEKNVEAAVSAIAEKHQAESPRPQQQTAYNEKVSLHQGDSGNNRAPIDGHDQYNTPRYSNEQDQGDDRAAITGLLRTIQKPLTTIGRMFSDEGSSSSMQPQATRASAPSADQPLAHEEERDSGRRPSSRHNLSAEEAAARQASAEAAEAERLTRAEHSNVVETLAGMFPDLDKDIISDVVYQKGGR
ncbi:hypothetical protein B0I35DRAFT_473398 [Stachybotrys elegans]|uniref:VPS9 domain-containing protein n=1 Tax=Stachybotrys elegans TaxID=80388 RepID=A0A8K0T3J5_9HYPO|nr:hypothetical protein B0I35DRAFT_473398 [Stachybotrys elegans]